MLKPHSIAIFLALTAAAIAQAPQVAISIGVRETGFAGWPFTNIGDNGGNTGGIEWVNKDGQTLTLDGTWQYFSFDLAVDPIVAFAGTSANGTLEGGWGTLENIRLLNIGGHTGPIHLWVDDVQNTITPTGGSPITTTFGTFAPFPTGTEVMFQEPTYSGSTSGHILAGATGGVDNLVASRTESHKCAFQFIDNTNTRWLRLTTHNALTQASPSIRFDQSSIVGFWLRGGVGQPDLGSQGPGPAIAELVGDGLNAGQTSTYHAGKLLAGAPGAVLISFPNYPDQAIFGGNLVSFGGLIFGASIPADPNGRIALAIPGNAGVFDLVIQSVFLDTSVLPDLLSFTNAIQAEFGR